MKKCVIIKTLLKNEVRKMFGAELLNNEYYQTEEVVSVNYVNHLRKKVA